MRSTGLLSILCILSCFTSNAQSVENSINLYGLNFPREKMHVHFDKESYLPGEDVWFKAYIFEDHLPSERSTNFYIALYDEEGKLLQQNMQPIIRSSADGNFHLPDSIKGKQVICRAYTSWMLNFDTSFLYSKPIRILKSNTVTGKPDPGIPVLEFFPEGGDVIEGERNTIAFKASYRNGLPFAIQALVKKQETGETLMKIGAEHDGMGKFDLEQLPGEHYYAEWMDDKGQLQRTYLPAARVSGVSLKLAQLNGKLFYNIVNKLPGDSLYILAYLYQKVVYKARLGLAKNDRTNGFIPLEGFPSGALQFTVFDQNWQPVAERICFINNNNYSSKVTLSAKLSSTAPRAKNEIVITVPDTLFTNMSLSVTDADINSDPAAGIINSMLLNADIRGYINNPSYYFAANDAASRQALDLLMLTHGWRKYNWVDMRAGKMPVINFPVDDYLTVYGSVNQLPGTKKLDKEQVNLIVKTKDSVNHLYSVFADDKGMLKASGLIFFDTAKVFFSFNKSKANTAAISLSKENNTLRMGSGINNYQDFIIADAMNPIAGNKSGIFKYYLDSNRTVSVNGEKTLGSVTVKSKLRNWRNDPLVKMDEKYASGFFQGGATSYSFDVLNDEQAETKFDVFNYLAFKVPGLSIQYPKQSEFIGGGKVLSHSFHGVPRVYIDQTEQSMEALQSLQLSQIAYVKYMPNFAVLGAEPGTEGIPSALVIYTRKGDDLHYRPGRDPNPTIGRKTVAGYTPVKVFYAPDYAQMANPPANDARSTLLWQPYLVTDKSLQSIPVTFYNNDFTKRIRIVLEGINEAGKLVHVEKVIE